MSKGYGHQWQVHVHDGAARRSRVVLVGGSVQRQLRAMAVVLALVASACVPSSFPEEGTATTATTAETTTTSGASRAESTIGTTTTSPLGRTESTVETTTTAVAPPSREEIVAMLPSTPVTTAPSGAVRASVRDRQETKLACIRSFGFAAELDLGDLGIVVDLPPEQQDEYFEVLDICRRRLFAELGVSEVPSREELTAHYRAYLYVRECMIAEGYPVDDPPSLEVYVESLGAAWHPYDAVMAGGQGSPGFFSRLEETCPQDLFYLLDVLDLDE